MMELQAELNIPLADDDISNSFVFLNSPPLPLFSHILFSFLLREGFGIYIGNGEWLNLFKDPKDAATSAALTSSFAGFSHENLDYLFLLFHFNLFFLAHLKMNYRKRGSSGTFETINEYLSSTLRLVFLRDFILFFVSLFT